MSPSPLAVDTSGLHRRLADLQRARPGARRAAVVAMGETIVASLAANSPRDTRRYVRGWILAGRGAGVGAGAALPPLQASARREEFIGALTRQVERWAARVEQLKRTYAWMYERQRPTKTGLKRKRPRPYERKLRSQIARAEKTLERAKQELEKALGTRHALLIGLYGRGDKGNGRRLGTTVRDKVYGGTGRIINGPDATVLVLHNMEPHARIVEKNKGVLARAQAAARTVGLRRVGAAYVKALQARAGGAGGAGGVG